MDEYAVAQVQHWDDAVVGSSVLPAAAVRLLADEAQAAMGRYIVASTVDINRLYDDMQYDKLVQQAITLVYPLQVLTGPTYNFRTGRR